MPLPPAPPTSKRRERPEPICHDCQSAETLVRLGFVPKFTMARIAVGNDRQEQFRLPGVPMGLVQAGLVRPSAKGDFERQLAWLDAYDHFGLSPELSE